MELATEETKPVNDKKADLVAQAKLLNQLLLNQPSRAWKNPDQLRRALKLLKLN